MGLVTLAYKSPEAVKVRPVGGGDVMGLGGVETSKYKAEGGTLALKVIPDVRMPEPSRGDAS